MNKVKHQPAGQDPTIAAPAGDAPAGDAPAGDGPNLVVTLFQPEIPQNAGTILRLCACLGLPCALIEPAGFVLNNKHFRRAGMDYLSVADFHRFQDYNAFRAAKLGQGRQILLTTKAATPVHEFTFEQGDCLIFGQESKGAPDWLHKGVDQRIIIPMKAGTRSLNIAMSVAMTTSLALAQLNSFP